MKILVENWQDEVAVTDEIIQLLENAALISFENERFTTPSKVNCILANNEQIREINVENRNIDKPTDVLSFPMIEIKCGEFILEEGDVDKDDGFLILGDIVISLEKVSSQAIEFGHSFSRELAFLMTHGIYHLLGYDHETPNDENIMISKQEKVLEIMNLGR